MHMLFHILLCSYSSYRFIWKAFSSYGIHYDVGAVTSPLFQRSTQKKNKKKGISHFRLHNSTCQCVAMTQNFQNPKPYSVGFPWRPPEKKSLSCQLLTIDQKVCLLIHIQVVLRSAVSPCLCSFSDVFPCNLKSFDIRWHLPSRIETFQCIYWCLSSVGANARIYKAVVLWYRGLFSIVKMSNKHLFWCSDAACSHQREPPSWVPDFFRMTNIWKCWKLKCSMCWVRVSYICGCFISFESAGPSKSNTIAAYRPNTMKHTLWSLPPFYQGQIRFFPHLKIPISPHHFVLMRCNGFPSNSAFPIYFSPSLRLPSDILLCRLKILSRVQTLLTYSSNNVLNTYLWFTYHWSKHFAQ